MIAGLDEVGTVDQGVSRKAASDGHDEAKVRSDELLARTPTGFRVVPVIRVGAARIKSSRRLASLANELGESALLSGVQEIVLGGKVEVGREFGQQNLLATSGVAEG